MLLPMFKHGKAEDNPPPPNRGLRGFDDQCCYLLRTHFIGIVNPPADDVSSRLWRSEIGDHLPILAEITISFDKERDAI